MFSGWLVPAAIKPQTLRTLVEIKLLGKDEQRRLMTDVIQHAAGSEASAVEVGSVHALCTCACVPFFRGGIDRPTASAGRRWKCVSHRRVDGWCCG